MEEDSQDQREDLFHLTLDLVCTDRLEVHQGLVAKLGLILEMVVGLHQMFQSLVVTTIEDLCLEIHQIRDLHLIRDLHPIRDFHLMS